MSIGLVFLLVIAACAAGVGGYFYFRPRQVSEVLYYHFQCPSCQRKLRYRAHKAGHPGMCPRCRKPCTFPLAPTA
jgi:hypothetical protein